ncbi:hypothetical protein A3709_19085 [Halioglobus sp. HI00S01]|uniref:DNA polymerase III subunit beta n=1 Tax=Halioglobus sp. HI00S01 TaxID=1822214 RepID=UPI0007C37A47|nr:DNA polymerase III subunit beta [Halioglobus sp. HI00S01]KZX57730.1 hypothetical protein A3709_19085 [Halioglobus sp. HI00S01]
MKFKVNKSVIYPVVSRISAVVDRKQTLDILGNLALELSGNALTITGTDNSRQLTNTLEVVGAGDGVVTVPAKKLSAILHALDNDSELSFTMSKDGSSVTLTAGKSRYKLATIDFTNFPKMEALVGTPASVSVEASRMAEMLMATSYAMARNDVRFFLNGLLLDIKNSVLSVVATDGHRLAKDYADVQCDADVSLQVILPREAVEVMESLLKGADSDVNIALGELSAEVSVGRYVFRTKLIDGKFPDYERVIPKDHPRSVTVDASEFSGALRRSLILANEQYRGVSLSLGEGTIKVDATNPQEETALETVGVESDSGEGELGIGLNGEYMLSAMRASKSGVVAMCFKDGNSPVVITDPGSDTHLSVVMPMRIGS